MQSRECALGIRLLCILLAVAGIVIAAAPAYAHVFPDRMFPKAGSEISPPGSVRIWFDGALEPAFCILVVKGPDGKQIDRKDVRVNASDPTLLEVSLPGLPAGAYHVFWDVVARDGHRTTGDYSFRVR